MKRILYTNIPSYWLKRMAAFIASVAVPCLFLGLSYNHFSQSGFLGTLAYLFLFALLSVPALTLAVSLTPWISESITEKFSDHGSVGLLLQVFGVSLMFFTLYFMEIPSENINQMLHIIGSFVMAVLSCMLLLASAISSLDAVKPSLQSQHEYPQKSP